MRSLRNTERVLKNDGVKRILEIEREKGATLTIDDIHDQVAGIYPKVMLEGDMEAGAWSCGMVAGLIHDVPTLQGIDRPHHARGRRADHAAPAQVQRTLMPQTGGAFAGGRIDPWRAPDQSPIQPTRPCPASLTAATKPAAWASGSSTANSTVEPCSTDSSAAPVRSTCRRIHPSIA